MIDPFSLKLFLSFIFGSLWITIATLCAERFGSKVGGAILGVPSVALLGLFFIGWTQSIETAVEATTVVPIVMGIVVLFMAIYLFLLRFNFYLALFTGLLIWFSLSLGLVWIRFDHFGISLVSFFILLIASYFFVERIINVPSRGKKKIKRNLWQLVFRALFSGAIVSLAVVMTKLGGPLLGGIFASFPGLTVATMIITYYAYGREFSAAVIKSLMVIGPWSVVIYAICVKYFYEPLGLFAGTIVSFLISLISSYLTYLYFSKRLS